MIIIIEPVCTQNIHVPFCAAFIESVGQAFPKEQIRYCATSIHIVNVKSYRDYYNVDNTKINWDIIDDFEYGENIINESKRTLRLVNEYQKLRPTQIYVSTTNLMGLFFLYFKNKSPITSVFPVLHRSVSQLQTKKNALKFVVKLIASRNYLRKNIYPQVLSKQIIDNVGLLFPSFSKQFQWINHPYFFNNDKSILPSNILNVGFLGRGCKDRGYDKFLAISQKAREINFYGLGSLANDIDDKDQFALKVKMKTGQLATDLYIDGLTSLDAVIMPLDSNSYSYTMSGAIMDVLSFKKLLLLLDSDFSRSLIARFGRIGKIFKNENELLNFLKKSNYTEIEKQEFEEIILAQENILSQFNCDYVSKQIKQNFDETFINNQ